MTVPPDLSVVVPTHNRRPSVERLLLALTLQTLDPQRFEVIVVADGCTDDTGALPGALPLPFQLTVAEQPNQGQGKARNEGAARARGQLLVFLDDDIEPLPGLLDAYREAHRLHPDHLLIGQSTPVLDADSSLFHQGLRNWWSDHTQSLKAVAHRYTYRDMHSGNFAIAAALFTRAGGFDPEFFGRSGEDYELGVRLMNMGVPFLFLPEAEGYHHDKTTFPRSLLRVRMEGRADVLIGLRHPEVRSGLPLAWIARPGSRGMSWLRAIAFRGRHLGDLGARLLAALLRPLELFRLRASWRGAHGALRSYWYARGVADELGSLAQLQRFLDGGKASEETVLDMDLALGIQLARVAVDRIRPKTIRLHCASLELGEIPEVPGGEPLAGRHLPAALAVRPRPLAVLAGRVFAGLGAKIQVDQPGSPPSKALPLALDSRSNRRGTVTELEMTRPSGPVNCSGSDFIAALVRYEGRPLGWLNLACTSSTMDEAALCDSALRTFGLELAAESLLRPGGALPDPPPISLVICTRDRAQLLERCLSHVGRLRYPVFETIVVDNAPSDQSTRQVAGRFPVRYVREDRPGLDWARNRGIAEARHGIIAFTDDDATPDAEWLNGLAAGFENPAIMAVTGLVAPMELATEAQVLFEQVYGGMGKGVHGRLFHRDQMRPSQMIAIHELGVGANMAFRRNALERLGGFDTALDVGTAACGAGDLDMFHRVIAAGMPLWYEPGALVWHQHRREVADLRRQLYNDGRSFAVYLLKLWRDRTVPRRSVARYAVWVWGRWLAGRVILGALGRHRLPFSVLWANLRGAMDGPRAFFATYRHDRRQKKSEQ